ncbi:MAG: cyclic nucleotide-binding domain-containing protein [Panacibacter sp.]
MTSAAIARLLNVRKEERWIVTKLFWIQFFQGAGIAFFFTSAYASFLNNHNVSDLSVVYMYTALALWITGFIYGKLEHKYHVANFSRYIVIFMSASILLIRVVGYSIVIQGFDYFILVWFNVLYLLSNLEFWGIAALVFEVRQSKRLFSIISAGDIPAKFIGYSLATLAVPYVGTANLLIPAFLCMLISLPFLQVIVKSGTLHDHEKKHAANNPGHHEKMIGTFVKHFTTNKLILWLAILSFIMSVCIVVANFSFYSKIKEAYHSDIELAVFIGSFLAVIRICALLVKLLFTSKLISLLGVKRSLMFTPVIFAGCITVVILFSYIFPEEKAVLYTFGITCIILDVLKTAINSPVFLSIMQPMNIHDRLRSHNIVKGIMDPFAYLFSGVILFELIKIQRGINLTTLSVFLLLLSVFWILSIFFVNREYYSTVLKAITSKFYNRSDLVIDDDDNDAIAFIRGKLESGSETEITHMLRILRFQSAMVLNEDITGKLLLHASESVKNEMLLLYEAGIINILPEPFKQMLDDNTISSEVRHKAFSALCNAAIHDETLIFSYATKNDAHFKAEAIGTVLSNPGSDYFDMANILLQDLIVSESRENRITAARCIVKSRCEQFKESLIGLMNDKDMQVSKAAVNLSGSWDNEDLIKTILTHIKTKRKEVFNALLSAGPAAVPYIIAYILSTEANYEEKKQLIKICGTIGGEATGNTLADLYPGLPEHAHVIIKAIYNCDHTANIYRAALENMAQKYIADAAAILLMQKNLYPVQEKFALLMDTLTIELNEIRDSLLYIFSVLYKPSEIEKVRRSLALNSGEQTANAFEMLEMMVPKKLSHDFIIIYEKGDIEQRCSQLHSRKSYTVKDKNEIPVHILRGSEVIFQDWSKACAAYTLDRNKAVYDSALIKRYLYAENRVLNETANFTVNHVMNSKLLLLEKVLVLKRTSIFSDTPENILADLAPLMQEIELPAGSIIFKEDAIGDSMYIIFHGSVRIHKDNTTLAVLDKENEVFGELSLFDSEKRSASATANSDCFLFKIDQLPFYELIETRPEIIKGAVKMLCKRLRAQNERTVQMGNTNN